DTIARHPGQHYARLERALQHLLRQSPFGSKSTVVGNARAATAVAILSPFFWQIELAIEQCMAEAWGVGQKDADLAVLNLACCAAILARHSRRMPAFLEKPGLINDSHSITIGQKVSHIGSQPVTQHIRIPVGAAEQMLKAIRIGVAADLSQLPAIL